MQRFVVAMKRWRRSSSFDKEELMKYVGKKIRGETITKSIWRSERFGGFRVD
jgi:hypothetical protein